MLALAFDATNAVNFQDKSISGEYYEEWCNEIRFGSYRTAAKLRALQHRTGLVHIDIWNMIEAFRENGLNTMETRLTLVLRPAFRA